MESIMVSDWPTMESSSTDININMGMNMNGIMQTDGDGDDNHADLFGGDLFSDELLDIYNSSTGENVDIPHLMGQNDNADADADADATQNTHQNNSGAGVGVGYSLGELKSSSSMNDFTAILESPQQAISTTSKAAVDTMLLPKDAVVAAVVPSSVPSASSVQVQVQVPVPVQAPQQQVQQQQIAPQQQQVQQQQVQQQQPLAQQTQSTTTTAAGSTTTTVGKKRAADAPQSNPCVKKKATGKASSKVGNRGSTTSTAASGSGRRASSSSTKGDGKKNNSTSSGSKSNNNNNNNSNGNNNDISDAAKKATSKDAKGATSNIINNSNSNTTNSNNSSNNNTNKANITDPLTVQAQKALTQKVTAANKNKVQTAPPAPTVAQQPQPAHVPSSYQPGKAQTVVTTSTASTTATTNRASSKVGTTAVSSAASSSSNVKTEESFKGVAQAAVNNLILSAGQNAARYEAGKGDSNNPFSKPVDTSTAHVAALTSNNWVAACAASISDAPPGTAEAAQAAALAAASDPAAAKAARARRATLTADERARQNRDRNREHARNTRLRKKAYVEELKRTLTELVTTRDAAELERRHEKQRELEVREVRYRVMEEFLKLRSKGSEANLLARWVAILEDGFTLTLPRTDYRDMVQNQNGMARQVSRPNGGDSLTDPTVQVLRGATECFDDAAKVAIFLQSLQVSNGNIVQAYNCDRKKFMMDGINAMLEWTFTSTNMDNTANIILKGCMRATFSPASNKLVCAELLFDSGSVVAQVKSLMSFQDVHSPTSGFACIAETDALLDSVLPQAPSVQSVKQECSVSVVSTDKGDTSSDEECLVQQQQCKQEPTD